MTYREQEVRERPIKAIELRCYCDAPAEVNCDSCRRPRCAAHVAEGLCSRCSVVINRALDKDRARRWEVSVASGVAVTVGALVLKLFAISLAGPPLAVGGIVLLRRLRRRTLVKELRAPLALSTGDVAAPVEHEEPFPTAPPPRSGYP